MADRALQSQKDTLRVPLYGDTPRHYHQVDGSGTQIEDRCLINCYATKDPSGNVEVIKRCGTGGSGTQPTLTGKVNNVNTLVPIAVCTMTTLDNIYVVAYYDTSNNNIYVIQESMNSATTVAIGNFASPGAHTNPLLYKCHLTELVVAGVPTLGLAINYGDYTISAGYKATSAAGTFVAATLTLINDVDYPANIAGECTSGPMVQLNTCTYIIGRTGKVYNSDRNSITSWNALGVQPASIEPDLGKGVAKYKNHIVAFGDNSIEFFQDAGLAPPAGPLQRVEQAFIRFGTIGSQTFINIEDDLYWISQGQNWTLGLWKLNQYTPVKLSEHWLGRYVFPVNLSTNLRLDTIVVGGKRHILINGIQTAISPVLPTTATFTTTGDTYPVVTNDVTSNLLCFNVEDSTWWNWSEGTWAGLNMFVLRVFNTASIFTPKILFKKYLYNAGACTASQFTFQLNDDVGSDSTAVIDADQTGAIVSSGVVCITIQLNPIEFLNENRKAINKVKIICDNIQSSMSAGLIHILVNRKDGAGTQIERLITVPNTTYRYYINNLGMARKLTLAIVAKNPNAFRGKALEMIVTQGTS